VIVLDSASAAVLRNPTSFTRAVRPGIVFTRKDEFVVEAVDLRRQTKPQPPLGPRDEENPFEPKGQESDDAYAERQARRHETSGLTRDGIEVVPNIMAAFILAGPPRRKGQPYVFNHNSVWKAVTAGRLNSDSKDGTNNGAQNASQVPLSSLPAYLAADVFREGLRKFTFDELFKPLDDGKTAYQRILQLVQARLTQAEFDELDDTGHPTTKKVQSREFQILQERGIRVLGTVVMNPRFLPEIENRMVSQWRATWLQRAQMERIQIEKRRADAALEGKQDALKQFAQIASQRFDGRVFGLPAPKNAQEEQAQMQIALERLVQGTLQGAASDSQIYLYLSGGEVNLNNILDWVRGAGE
jgi:hypothetical protein